jgi:predicted DCC family thiol-disulfide oxidoreductase YuxK
MPETPSRTIAADAVEAYRAQIEGRPIVLFDGVCVFCNRTVQFLLGRDRHATLRFVPLESPLGKELLARFNAQRGPEGIVLITDALTPAAHLSRRTEAFSDTLSLLEDPWRTLGKLLHLIPRPLRELGYGVVVRYRYRLFGRYLTCPIPTPEQRSRILGIPS